MQQTKRRSKKGVILLALALALFVLAIVPASALAVNQAVKTTLDSTTPAWALGQGGHNWVNTNTLTGTFNSYKDVLGDGTWVPATTADVTSIVYYLDGYSAGAVHLPFAGNPTTSAFTFSPTGDGKHTVTSASETTLTGGLPAEPWTNTDVYVDTVAPVWAWTLSPADPGGDLTSPNPAQWYGNVSVNFTGTASDPGGSGVASATADWTNLTTSTAAPTLVMHNDGVPTAANPWIYDVTGTVTPPTVSMFPADSTTVSLVATDVVGNVGSRSFVVNFDVWPPVTSYHISPAGADTFAGYTNQDVTVTFTASDVGGAGVDYTEYIVKTSTTTAAPATPALGDSGTHGTSVKITETAPVGPVYVYYRSVDKAVPANKEAWHLVKVFIDKLAPALSDDVPSTWIDAAHNNTLGANWQYITVLLTATDPNSGLAPAADGLQFMMPSWRNYLTLPPVYPYAAWKNYVAGDVALAFSRVTHENDGIFPLSYRASDNAGNQATAEATVKIDTRAPVTDGASGWINGLVPYKLTATDQATGAGVAATIYRVNQATKWTDAPAATVGTVVETPITLAPATQGAVFTIDFGSVDAALPYDYNATVVPYNTPAGIPSYNWGNSEFSSWLWGGITDQGWIAITGYKTRTVKLDVTAPSVTAVDPKNGAWQKGPAVVNFSGTDVGSGYAYTEWSTDGGANWTKGEVAEVGGNGEITVTYHGVDNVGIKSADQTIVVKVASTPPTVTGGNVTVKKGHKATFKFNVTAVTPTAQVIIQIRTKNGVTLSTHHYASVTTNADGTRSFKVNLKKGKYNIRIGAVDEAGNVQTKRGGGTLTVK